MTPDVTLPTPGVGPRRLIRRFRVAVVAGPHAGRTWAEVAEHCSIGSHPSNALVIDDPTVSRFHCELAVAGDRVRVRDLGSRNGTVAHGMALADAFVPGGTLLVLGKTQVRVEVDVGQAALEASERTGFGPLAGASPQMRELFGQLERVAPTDATVLIEGETGTGKEGVAEAVHDASARSTGKFVVVDCGAIPANLLEAELFGYEAGAFTGATERRIGAFEDASGGTLFLDELGELPVELQPKLLRALESREVRRIGSRNVVHCDVRIVAATNRDLRSEVNKGTFRADLYYRLAVVRVELPPLRERTSDMALLVGVLLDRLKASAQTKQLLMADDFIAELSAARWPGNVRELRNHLEQCVVFGERRAPTVAIPAVASAGAAIDVSLPYEVARRNAIDAFERAYLEATLAKSDGNVAQAARETGLNRAYLHRMLRRHGLR